MFTTIWAAKNHTQCIAKNGKPFADGGYIKEAFPNSSELFLIFIYIFNGLPNKGTIISRTKDMPARTVERRITDMAENGRHQQTLALKGALLFSVAEAGKGIRLNLKD